MPNPRTSCFPCARPSPPPPPRSPTLTTTLYDTPLGPASLTWSRSPFLLGPSLSVHLPLSPSPSSSPSPSFSSTSSSPYLSSHPSFQLRPFLPWRRRGSKRIRLNTTLVVLTWDLSRATFLHSSPEPTGRFFLSITVDGEVALVVGDAGKAKEPKSGDGSLPLPATVVWRREHVVLEERGGGGGGGLWPCEYVTKVRVAGRERKLTVELGGRAEKDVRMCVAVDGKRILQVKHLRWKFRGNERIELDGCGSGGSAMAVLVSWDVHNYLFPTSAALATTPSGQPPPPDSNNAIVLFRFETEPKPHLWIRPNIAAWGVYGLLGHVGAGERSGGGGGLLRRRLMKTRSVSSASSVASSGSGWSVAEWQSTEENELKEASGFSLLISFARR